MIPSLLKAFAIFSFSYFSQAFSSPSFGEVTYWARSSHCTFEFRTILLGTDYISSLLCTWIYHKPRFVMQWSAPLPLWYWAGSHDNVYQECTGNMLFKTIMFSCGERAFLVSNKEGVQCPVLIITIAVRSLSRLVTAERFHFLQDGPL